MDVSISGPFSPAAMRCDRCSVAMMRGPHHRSMSLPPPDPLNPAQLQAVHHLHGPCLVLAGAGSGKTRVIVHKIAKLMHSGLEPSKIAAITFKIGRAHV